MERKIHTLKEISGYVILDFALENGAIVAANCFKEYFPKDVSCYSYVWPRDASFACVAADILGIENIQDKFFDWCLNRAEDFKTADCFMRSTSPMA